MAPPRTPKLLLLACLLCLVAACGVNGREGTAAMGAGAAPTVPARAAAAPAAVQLQFGTEHRFASGITVSVSPPQSFQPSPAAYPRSARAASFGIEVTNNGADTYRLSRLAVTAHIAGTRAKQVVDATQGLGGIPDADNGLPPGHSAQLTIAFAVPGQAAELTMRLRPSAAAPAVVTYCGKA
ncbi:hypothetical protein GCM10022222_69000 [Amycolatopsis ultiminotia]|uniref:DUF4352 domain-containing protein n=1 Tax=Amycolatopsis ultiminotia TaxID=543629 RepID=A0ABP6Y0C6_9PSEU